MSAAVQINVYVTTKMNQMYSENIFMLPINRKACMNRVF